MLVLPSSIGNRPAEPGRAFFRDGENQRPVLNHRVRGIEVDQVPVERPVALCPAGGVEGVELVCPVEHELAVVIAVVLDPVDELVRGQRGFIQRAGPAARVARPRVEAQRLGIDQVARLATFGLPDHRAVERPRDVLRRPFERVRVVAVGERARRRVHLLGRHPRVSGDEVRLPALRVVLAEDLDVGLFPGRPGRLRAVLVREERRQQGAAADHPHPHLDAPIEGALKRVDLRSLVGLRFGGLRLRQQYGGKQRACRNFHPAPISWSLN